MNPPSILHERNYLTYLCGSLFSTQGIWIQRMTLGWMIWDLTHSETWLGLLTEFAGFGPSLLLPGLAMMAASGYATRNLHAFRHS